MAEKQAKTAVIGDMAKYINGEKEGVLMKNMLWLSNRSEAEREEILAK